MKPVIVLSSCLGSEACRYNGQALNESIVAALSPFVTFRSVCPEVSIGLGTPRETIRLQAEAGETRLIRPATGRDVTGKMTTFSEFFLNKLSGIDGFLCHPDLSCSSLLLEVWRIDTPHLDAQS